MNRILLLLLVSTSCIPSLVAREAEKPSIIPKPAYIELREGKHTLTSSTRIVLEDERFQPVAQYLAVRLRTATGFPFPLVFGKVRTLRDEIVFGLRGDGRIPPEGYRMEVTRDVLHIDATTSAGYFYAVQTLFQLLPAEIMSSIMKDGIRWDIPCVIIEDAPSFSWRGMHLDVSRHFFPPDFIYTYIDMLAFHKFNVFHWHLTDDQGWRIEIRRYPALTSTGAWRVDHEDQHWNNRPPQKPGERATYGGFYTQDEIRDIVAYAASRHVTIVPEIEIPAHTTAALAAYPVYSCTGGPFTVPPGGVWPITDIYCAGNDSAIAFLANILTEVMELFPGPYIHIGGDEADKSEWKRCPKCQARIRENALKDEDELQSWFIGRIGRFISDAGRRMIGWDEIIEGGLAPGATVMSWRGNEGGIIAARQGHDVVMTPGSHCYFDYYQGKRAWEPPAIGGYTPLEKVYAFEPIPDVLTFEEAKRILGAQANVWTEYMTSSSHVQYMVLPRMSALAEVVWSPKKIRAWNDYCRRLASLLPRYEALGWNYARSAYQVRYALLFDSTRQNVTMELSTEIPSTDIRYRIEPDTTYRKYMMPIPVSGNISIHARAFRENEAFGTETEQSIHTHKAFLKPVRLLHQPERYFSTGTHALVDGITGSPSFDDGTWLGFHRKNLQTIVDLGDVQTIRKIRTRFLENTASWIFCPTAVEFAISGDGHEYSTVARFTHPTADTTRPTEIYPFESTMKPVPARYVRVTAENVGVCPPWHPGAGRNAWLFIDEISVE